MKVIFFYANFRTYDFTLGITRKVYSEIDAFRKKGYRVFYSGYLVDGVAIFDNENNIMVKKFYPTNISLVNHAIRRTMLINLCIKFLKRGEEKYAFSYVRYHFFDRKYIQLLARLKEKSARLIIEAHSTPKFAKGISAMTYIAWKDKKWSRKAKKYVDLVASMSDEEKLWGIHTVKISNGINVKDIRPHHYIGKEKEINLIAVSFESPVHGYDRVLRGIYNYYQKGGKRKIIFHIVGTTLPSTDRLIKKLNLENYCIKYGPQKGEELDHIYDKANLAVGCLANHRIGSFYGSALKTKEYIAKGIPFIYGWKENILENFKYAKCYELCEEAINIEDVIKFYDSLPKNNLVTSIRNCLKYEDTWDYQIERVLSACGEIE